MKCKLDISKNQSTLNQRRIELELNESNRMQLDIIRLDPEIRLDAINIYQSINIEGV